MIFVKNEAMLQRVQFDIANLATRALLFANCRSRYAVIEPGLDGVILNSVARGIPVVCLHHTGGAAEAFGKAVLERQNTKGKSVSKVDDPGKYRLPDNVSADSCLVLDTSSDSVEKVIDKLTLVLSSVQDDEMREVGNNQSEKERLFQAWTLYVLYRLNSDIQIKRAVLLHFLLITTQIISTALVRLPLAPTRSSRAH